MIRYLSVCSGIEAATQAWHPLGWTPVAFSEIEPHPCAVLAHHYPHVPNWGDMTKFEDWPDHAIDLLVGGTPCQDFSVAGLGAGLDGERGNLMLTYGAIARRYRPRWLVWENVPGVLSNDGGRAFGSLLGLLSGRRVEVPASGWKSAGAVEGISGAYGLAWRIVDAQFARTRRFPFAVPQRRRRVFVVGYLGDWRRAAAVLFDRDCLSGNPAPRREPGQSITHPVAGSLTSSGRGIERAGDTRGQDPVVATITSHDPACTLTARERKGPLPEADLSTVVAHTLRGEGFDASEDGTGRGTPIVPGAFDCKGTQVQFTTDGSHPTLRSMGHNASHQNAGGHAAVAFDTTQITSPGNFSNPRPGDPCHPLAAGAHPPAVAFDLRGRDGGAMPEGPHDTANLRAASGGSSRSYVAQPWAVRRLTPTECERLQGFPDDFTSIPTYDGWRRMDETETPESCEAEGMKVKQTKTGWWVNDPDGPRYKALGNSMAVNVMEWLGQRIAIVDAMEAAA